MTTINAASAQKQAARQKIIKQLQGAGATSMQMPGSVEVEADEAQEALADLLAKGEVREARSGLYYLDETNVKEAQPGNGFVALLIILIVISVTASVVALTTSGG
ncbi:hypothetical protein [Sphingomonas alba]|uniref:Uncharacterized protein n=1 Tax=Sphingomonas alba TaxID=2908208 RepID=A0ABT0RLB6_9SPHN|nr:hypothetical protein [Sphingomonas alba]MCL6683432.1 hypothetical protein [Sphingomonas alba]